MTATAVAHPNIALVKYWGKADADLALPATGSVSMGLDVFPTTTSVTLDADREARDTLTLNGRVVDDGALVRVERFLDLVRDLSGSDARAAVVSENTVPTGAGLASSASGFAALAVAAASAYGLDLSSRDLSRLARRGSGSATRSIPGGVAVWHAGDDEGSFAETIPAPPMAMVVVTIDDGPKEIGSREAMRRTIATSPFYPAWVTSTTETVQDMLAACAAGDFTRIGELTESNALRMHATIEGAFPPDPLPEQPQRRGLRRRRRAAGRRPRGLRHRRRRPERRRALPAGGTVPAWPRPWTGSARSSSPAPDQPLTWSAPNARGTTPRAEETTA
ncbi:diphosphomevalonate decarboxylase [Curtobacterium sp. MCJR17_043]|uniref:diphosphomevalonate decarboxylase n=1 Tax=Curtobacterium sp. MCJR17_043 TaxID=2175660 RepID=UPI0024DF35D2|nr:diphosphomevalonate decarboxylase [Curtobacterium sp. MCJR17_043]WIB35627.1 diphosphomevalonate decarboxylase [Curtobacterium sp. MCJR17_043]